MNESPPASPGQALGRFVDRRITELQRAYLDPTRSDGRAHLAQLRHAGPEAGGSPDTWLIEFEGFPEALIGRGDAPSQAERSAHLAFMLFAVHQQAKPDPMHRPGTQFGLGRAVALLQRQAANSDPLGKLPTRFAALGTASDFHEISHYARQLITQLRAVSLPLDYGTLAKQLYCLQVPSLADGVRLAWGRDFAQAPTATTDPSNPSTQKEA